MTHLTLTNGHDPVRDASLVNDPIVNPALLNAARMFLSGELEPGHLPDLPVYSQEWLLMRDAVKFAANHNLNDWVASPEYQEALGESVATVVGSHWFDAPDALAGWTF